jgi:hypothetical protein
MDSARPCACPRHPASSLLCPKQHTVSSALPGDRASDPAGDDRSTFGTGMSPPPAHGPGDSFLRESAVQAPDLAARVIEGRRDSLRANMSATLRAMKAAAESRT